MPIIIVIISCMFLYIGTLVTRLSCGAACLNSEFLGALFVGTGIMFIGVLTAVPVAFVVGGRLLRAACLERMQGSCMLGLFSAQSGRPDSWS